MTITQRPVIPGTWDNRKKSVRNTKREREVESPSNVESADDRKVSRAVYQAIKECVRAVDERPTAFDTDKVISELKRDKFVESECILSDIHQGYNAGLSRAIEIVKKGGVE